MKDKLIWCDTKEKLEKVAQKLKSDGFSITDTETIWRSHGAESVLSVHANYKSITYCSRDWYIERGYATPITADEFLGKSKSPHIVIFRRGREVIAKDVATGNKGIAKCSPDDEFVFKTGASIALARLMAKTPDALNHDVKDEWIKVLGLTPVKKRVFTDADRNFKVGDRVVVRDWDDMEREFERRDGGIRKSGCCTLFIDSMRHLCGRTATVVRVYDADRVEVDFDNKSGNTDYFYRAWMFNPIDTPKLFVGYHVIIRQWDDMKKTGRQDNAGNIFDTHHNGCFSTAMKSICGKEVEIIEIDPNNNERFKIAAVINGYIKKWWVRTWMIERLVQKPTPSFKVGDYVTLKEGLASGKRYDSLTLWSGRMYDIANGKRLEVESVNFCEDDGMYHYRCKNTDHDRYYYTEAMLDKWDESKIHEGDTVRVVNSGLNYSSYVMWVGEHISDPYMAARFCFGSPFTDKNYKVIKIAEHERNHRALAYIEETDGLGFNKCYLIEVEGLEKV